jgi:hypothetical protein
MGWHSSVDYQSFSRKRDPCKTFFIVIGHVFIVGVVYELVGAALLSTLPTLTYQ